MKKAFERNNAHFYEALKKRAVDVKDHHDKQRFLKVLYEEFYKAYNPKGAVGLDKLEYNGYGGNS